MHPVDEIREIKSIKLSGKKIVLGVTGSIAAVKCVQLSRELIRHGAEVFPVMTHSATKIIHPDALEFSTGNKPIVELTGKLEHVSFCGRIKEAADLLLISPCTANTISKIALGIDDTTVTTFATTALGSGIPILLAPSMHLSMYDHPIVQDNIKRCKHAGIKFVGPTIVRNKAKIENIENIVAYVIREIGKKDLVDKKILVIGGTTAEYIDDVRMIINRSSGKTAVSLSTNAFERGAYVKLLYGWSKEIPPSYIPTKQFKSIKDLFQLLKNVVLKKFNIIIVCAALADYIPKKHGGKIPSGKKDLVISLISAPKVLAELRKQAPNATIIAFKVEETREGLIEKALEILKRHHLNFVVANTIDAFEKDEAEIWIINKNGRIIHKQGKKYYLAKQILDSMTH